MVETAPNVAGALVLAVGLDELSLGRIRAIVRATELSVEAVSHEGAVERAQNADEPIIALLEWTEEQEELQTRLCAALRRATRPGQCHVVALGGSPIRPCRGRSRARPTTS